jgi:hypothetical protein
MREKIKQGTITMAKTIEVNDPMTALRAEFDQQLAWLNEPGAADKLRRLFGASTAEIAQAANEAASHKREGAFASDIADGRVVKNTPVR